LKIQHSNNTTISWLTKRVIIKRENNIANLCSSIFPTHNLACLIATPENAIEKKQNYHKIL
jgi:hypothetical protein